MERLKSMPAVKRKVTNIGQYLKWVQQIIELFTSDGDAPSYEQAWFRSLLCSRISAASQENSALNMTYFGDLSR